MALRDLAGDMARNSAGLWKAVADAVDPKPPRPRDPAPSGADHEVIRHSAVDPSVATPADQSGQMLVPVDAWTRILEQVGHVHEAGQQLADARERAAKAETENEFLKEQLRDLKAQKRTPRRPAAPGSPRSAATSPVPAADPIGRARVRKAREVASRWLNPS